MAKLQQEILLHRLALKQRDADTMQKLITTYDIVRARMDREANKIERSMKRAIARGEEPSLSMLYQQGRVQSLQEQLEAAIAKWNHRAGKIIEGAVEESIDAGFADAMNLTDIATPDVFKPHLAEDAIEHMIAQVESKPVRDVLINSALDFHHDAADTLVAAVTLGKNPRQVARELRDGALMPLNKALLIARTEQMRAYRGSSQVTYSQNSEILRGWVWVCALDERSCASCIAQHGKRFPTNEQMATHPNCRCTMAPDTGDEFTLDDLPGPGDGELFFDRQSAAFQRKVLGVRGQQLYANRQASLTDWLHRTYSPVWGPGTRQASLKTVLGRVGLPQETFSAAKIRKPTRATAFWTDSGLMSDQFEFKLDDIVRSGRRRRNVSISAIELHEQGARRTAELLERIGIKIPIPPEAARSRPGGKIRFVTEWQPKDATGIAAYSPRNREIMFSTRGVSSQQRFRGENGLGELAAAGLHESGHALDNAWSRTSSMRHVPDRIRRVGTYQVKSKPKYRSFDPRHKEFVAFHEGYRSTKQAMQYQFIKEGIPSAPIIERIDDYIMSPEEVWARSFAQYAAEKAGDADAYRALRGLRMVDVDASFDDEDWAIMRPLVEAVLKAEGAIE